jgi:hypothetical protein
MFMTPDELIDSTNKMDSRFYDPYENTASAHPRAQWEAENSSRYGRESLREEKLEDLDTSHHEDFHGKPYETMPPVELVHYRAAGSKRPLLAQGHHRLAKAEDEGYPYLAVIHHRGEV